MAGPTPAAALGVDAMLTVMVTSPERVLFDGTAASVSLPGEQGTFEVLTLHRSLVSRLLSGPVVIDGRTIPIQRGIVRVADDVVTAVVEVSR
jgi:F-type H+-transporting ATPase subunit epsilon